MDKVNQNATLMFYMDIMPVKWPRHKVDNPAKQKTKAPTVKYFETEYKYLSAKCHLSAFCSSIGFC